MLPLFRKHQLFIILKQRHWQLATRIEIHSNDFSKYAYIIDGFPVDKVNFQGGSHKGNGAIKKGPGLAGAHHENAEYDPLDLCWLRCFSEY